jgi:hypothetical protein
MLKTKLTVLLLLGFGSAFSQSFHKIPSSGAWWRIEHSIYMSPTEQYESNYLMYTDGDTMIAGYLCQKLVKTADSVCYRIGGCQGFGDSSAVANYGNIYQDSLGKIFTVWPTGQLNLMYDFGAQAGTMIHTAFGPTFHVDSVSIVMFTDGIPRRRQHVSFWNGQPWPFHAMLVEGIGDISRGLYAGHYELEGQNGLSCFDDGVVPVSVAVQEHCSPVFNCMQLQLASAPRVEDVALEVFPNPSPSNWQIQDPQGRLARGCFARVTDLFGNVVFEQGFNGGESISVGFEGASGIYILSLSPSQGIPLQTRLVRH